MHRLQRLRHLVAMASIYTLLFTFVTPNAALAKSPQPLSWDNVLKLRQGDKIRVGLFSKQVHNGKVDKVEPNGITLTAKEGSLLLPKNDIESVAHFDHPKANILGAAVAAGGLGLAVTAETVGTAQDLNQLSNGQLTSSTGKHNIGLLVAGIVVAVGGIAIIVLGGRPRIIYEAKAPPPTAATR
jgi:hypothetical protein